MLEDFRELIETTIGVLLKENGHKMAGFGENSIIFMKRYSEDLAFYVRCIYYASWRKLIELHLMPVDIPDDSLFDIESTARHVESGIHKEAGIHIEAWTAVNNAKDYIYAIGKKVLALEEHMDVFAEIVLEELETPYFPDDRIQVNKQRRAIYRMVKEDRNIEPEFEALREKAFELFQCGQGKQVYRLGAEFIGQYSAEYFKEKGIDMELCAIRDAFSRQFYIQSMLDA